MTNDWAINSGFTIYQPVRMAPLDFVSFRKTVWSKPMQPFLSDFCEELLVDNIFRGCSRGFSGEEKIKMLRGLPGCESYLTIKHLLQAHSVLIGGGRGQFRNCAVQVGGGNEGCFGFIAPRYHIKNELEWLFRETRVIDEPSERIAFFLFYFLHIHPFLDGNGRTSRLALQVLMREIGGGEVSLFFSAMAWLIKDIFVAKLFLARSYGPAFLVDFVFDVIFLKKDVEDLVLGARGDSCEAIISVRNFLLKKWASSVF